MIAPHVIHVSTGLGRREMDENRTKKSLLTGKKKHGELKLVGDIVMENDDIGGGH